jgi:hypothetical protein
MLASPNDEAQMSDDIEYPALPMTWIAIATRPRNVFAANQLRWSELPGAVLSMSTARQMADRGLLVMANRHSPDVVTLVVRSRNP